jgi:hypothetical protein
MDFTSAKFCFISDKKSPVNREFDLKEKVFEKYSYIRNITENSVVEKLLNDYFSYIIN